MDKKQIIDGLKISINQLIPCTVVTAFTSLLDDFNLSQLDRSLIKNDTGVICIDANSILIWFVHMLEEKIFFKLTRDKIKFSPEEQRMIKTIPSLLQNLKNIHSKEFLGFSLKFSSRISFGDLIVAKFLEKEPAHALWNTISIIASLQELTFKRYEEQKCTSGFIYTDHPDEFIRQICQTNYRFYEFEEKTKLDYSFFDTPASFRYVDGRNSYYLIDDDRQVQGVIRLARPSIFSLIDRIGNLHLNDILYHMPGNNWIAFVGLKDEVFVIPGKYEQLKWSKNHWFLRDRSIIFNLLEAFDFKSQLIEIFVSIIFSLSELRFGSIILIPDDENELAPTIGKIDRTSFGNMLRQSIQSAGIEDLMSTDSLLGILASDGLTTISKKGMVISCGDIIDISKAAPKNIQGGGRSQAAIASSYYGLSIKISQDGPVSFFKKGELLIQV
ncbi:MAG: hypothetical protein ABIJ31_08065 [Pseudomonadota bacterium]